MRARWRGRGAMNGSWACPGWPVAEHHERGGSVHLVEASTVLMGFGNFGDEPRRNNALRVVYPRKDGNRPVHMEAYPVHDEAAPTELAQSDSEPTPVKLPQPISWRTSLHAAPLKTRP